MESHFTGGFSRGCEFVDNTGHLRDFFCYQDGQQAILAQQPEADRCQVCSKYMGSAPFEIVRVEYSSSDVHGVFYAALDQKLAGGTLVGDLQRGDSLARRAGLDPATVVEVLRGGYLPRLWTMATPDGTFELASGILFETAVADVSQISVDFS